MSKFYWLVMRKILFIILASTSITVNGQHIGLGQQLAEDAMALIIFIEMGNIGTKDQDCQNITFLTGDIEKVVDEEIAPLLVRLARSDSKSNKNEVDEMIQLLKVFSNKTQMGKRVLLDSYNKTKKEIAETYEKNQICTALSVMFQTIVHQRRLSLKQISKSLL